jgi:precorrin-6Y C5,15-methyltransferase (decarboxylating)
MKFYIIGISDESSPRFSLEAEAVIAAHRVFSGGERHRRIVAGALPEGARWIGVAVPLEGTFEQYRAHDEVVVFASGDPLFYGFAGTLMREFPEAGMVVIPAFHSLQMLAHRALVPYHDLHAVSLTGRPGAALDEALIAARPMIGVLTDTREHTPAKIARRMLDYGYDNYAVSVGERLGNREQERVVRLSVEEVAGREFRAPNVLILQKTRERERPLGIPDDELYHLPGRPGMITKMPIRLLALGLLDLRRRSVLWDVGSCTGSVSVEAKLQFPRLEVVAFERRPEGAQLLDRNARRWGTPGIRMITGDFRQADPEGISRPDAVFIGGYGGDPEGVVDRILSVIRPGGAIVFNSVSANSQAEFERIVSQKGLSLDRVVRLAVDEHNPIRVMRVQIPRP